MEPRLKTSQKWSPLPKELTQQIQSVFKQSFNAQIGHGKVESTGRIYPEEILVSIGYLKEKSIRQANWVISIAYKQNKDNVLKLLHLAVDAAAALFEQYFSAESDEEFPRLWEEVDFEGRKIFVLFSTVNSELEQKANQLLGVSSSEDEVAQGDWDSDVDPELIKAQLGLTDDDDEGDGSSGHHH